MTKNKKHTIEWYDDYSVNSVYIAAKQYDVKIAEFKSINKTTALVTVEGPSKNINRFAADFEEGDIEPFDSTADMSDSEYEEWLKYELDRIGVDSHLISKE